METIVEAEGSHSIDPISKLTTIHDLADILFFSIDQHPGQVAVVNLPDVLMGAARQNGKRPAKFEVAVPDSFVKNVRGNEKLRDVFLLMRIPRHVADQWANPSPIIIPGIIKP